jgi:5-formyltetrahydrofolate cyclo-ligase
MKPALRIEARRRLAALDPAERVRAEAAIAERVWSVPQVAAARTLLMFADLPQEVATGAMAAEALRRGMALVYPRTIPQTQTMTLHRVSSPAQLRNGNFGIREPDTACERVEESAIDAVLVPGLAWDRSGSRLGRGAGYFDRLFAGPAWRGFRCGIFFAMQEVDEIPRDPWDLPLDAVVTEREVWTGTQEVR